MSPSSQPPDLLQRLRKPLQYAATLPPERLPTVMPTLGKTLLTMVEAAPHFPLRLRSFTSLAADLDSLPPLDRCRRIRELLLLLEQMEAEEHPHSLPAPFSRSGRHPAGRGDKSVDIQFVKGVGPRMAERFFRLGIHTVEDLLYHLPSRYDDRRHVLPLNQLTPGHRATVMGEVITCGPVPGRRRRQFHVLLSDGTGVLNLVWFQYSGDYLKKRFHRGQWLVASGPVRSYRGALQMGHPEVEVLEEEGELPASGIVPVYPAVEGIRQKYLRRIMAAALESFPQEQEEFLPAEILRKRALLDRPAAFRALHSPDSDADLKEYNEHQSPGHRRLAYEEFFLLQLGLALRRRGFIEETARPVQPGPLHEQFRASLPFTLTSGQEKALSEILADLAQPHPMHRLLHGEVGSGKTVVALAAALAVIESGAQVALMAPTELLAEQHYRTVSSLLASLPVRAALLTSAVARQSRQQILAAASTGRVQILIGTHALLQEPVQFRALTLGIIDEQHRFGVLQRARLKAKAPPSESPHLLVMTATPIPRSLAMTVYGDLRVSVLRELPPGRQPVKTRLFTESQRSIVYELVRQEIKRGGQVFMVCPLIEESGALALRDAVSLAAHLQEEVFPEFRVGLVHGRMRPEEREAMMKSFAAGELDLLVATTVIEVGIDIPQASLMVVENAERFGLSQLHQLRGRVGRGARPSQCFLLAGPNLTEEGRQRLESMVRTNDGFRIAEEDLAMRGPGEFFGTRQSGLPDLRAANIIRHADILTQAREDAFALAVQDPYLVRPEHRSLRQRLLRRWGRRLKLGRVG